MKNFLISLFLLFSICLKSQMTSLHSVSLQTSYKYSKPALFVPKKIQLTPAVSIMNAPISSSVIKSPIVLTPGDHLIRAKNRALTSVVLYILGTTVVAIGDGDPSAFAVAGVCYVTGFSFGISAWSQVGKAGKALNKLKS